MQFNERIKYLREQEHITQKDMAQVLGISKSTYVKYERGEREPRYGILLALSKYFDVSIDFILGNSDEENKYKAEIDETFKYILGQEFSRAMGDNTKSVQKLIADFMNIIPLSADLPEMLDIIYVLNTIEQKASRLFQLGLHIFMYDKWALEDKEYKGVVIKPTNNDMIEFIQLSTELRTSMDSYISTLSSPEYFLNTHLKFEKEIREYSGLDKDKLIDEFHTHEIYKSQKIYKGF